MRQDSRTHTPLAIDTGDLSDVSLDDIEAMQAEGRVKPMPPALNTILSNDGQDNLEGGQAGSAVAKPDLPDPPD